MSKGWLTETVELFRKNDKTNIEKLHDADEQFKEEKVEIDAKMTQNLERESRPMTIAEKMGWKRKYLHEPEKEISLNYLRKILDLQMEGIKVPFPQFVQDKLVHISINGLPILDFIKLNADREVANIVLKHILLEMFGDNIRKEVITIVEGETESITGRLMKIFPSLLAPMGAVRTPAEPVAAAAKGPVVESRPKKDGGGKKRKSHKNSHKKRKKSNKKRTYKKGKKTKRRIKKK